MLSTSDPFVRLADLCDDVRDGCSGGFTIEPSPSFQVVAPTNGFLVSIASTVVQRRTFDRGAFLAAAAAWSAVIGSRSDLRLGCYRFNDGERVSVDLNVTVQDRGAAVRLGRALDQESIWDCAVGRSIDCGGTGTARTVAETIATLSRILGSATIPVLSGFAAWDAEIVRSVANSTAATTPAAGAAADQRTRRRFRDLCDDATWNGSAK